MKIETQSMADGLERPEGVLEAERQGQHTPLSSGNRHTGCKHHVLIFAGVGLESAAGLTGMTSRWQRTPANLWVFPIVFLSDWLQLGKGFICTGL